MTVLWLAFGIYIIGVAIVLYVRPNNMFRPGAGTWKEFGLNTTGNYTIFPFWLFTVLWALISYVLATLAAMFLASAALPNNMNIPLNNSNILPISAASSNNFPSAASSAQGSAAAPALGKLPGYYILQPAANGNLPQYVYFGTEPPTLANMAS